VGDSVLRLALSGNTISLSDYFTPFDQGNDDLLDYDVGSGGVLLLPDQAGAHPHEMVLGTKGGAIYLIDRDQMTTNNHHYCSGCTSDPEIVQEIPNAGVGEAVELSDSCEAFGDIDFDGTALFANDFEALRGLAFDGFSEFARRVRFTFDCCTDLRFGDCVSIRCTFWQA
jgi:hypothetical protein